MTAESKAERIAAVKNYYAPDLLSMSKVMIVSLRRHGELIAERDAKIKAIEEEE